MCFCASASFFLGTALLVTGGAALATVLRARKKNWLPFAAIPIIFGLQQCAEGIVWIASSQQRLSGAVLPASYFFLLCAFVIWPAWIPFSVFLIEPDGKRKKILFFLKILGFSVSALLLIQLFSSDIQAMAQGKHMYYLLTPKNALAAFMAKIMQPAAAQILCIVVYALATVMPFMISSWRLMQLFGASTAISCIATYTILNSFFVSVWCFFSAALSVFIVYLACRVKK